MTTSLHEEVSIALDAYLMNYVQSQSNPYYNLKFPSRYTPRRTTQPICDYIKGYSGPQEVLQQCCEKLIESIIKQHSLYFKVLSGHCYHSTSHMQLYAAVRVAYHSSLPNTDLVVRMLEEIFKCEGTFKNILIGAYYRPKICFTMTGVESLYSSLEEGLETFRYFLHHTNSARKLFKKDGVEKRMVDLSIEEAFLGHPAVYAIGANNLQTFQLLVEHGANLDDVTELLTAQTLLEMARGITSDLDTPEMKACRQIFRRAHPEVLERKEQTLMMLCRKVIRRELNRSFQLPAGIEALPLPSKIKEYLHLRCD